MNKYQFGKIYKLVSKETNLIYIGSTTNELIERFYSHKSSYKCEPTKGRKSYHMLKYKDCEIKLIENYPCNSKAELKDKERQIIINLGNPLNQQLPYPITFTSKKEYNKELMREKRKDINYKKKEIESKRKYRTTDKGKAEYIRKNEKRQMKNFYENYGKDINYLRYISINSLQIFPVSKEEKDRKRRREKRIKVITLK